MKVSNYWILKIYEGDSISHTKAKNSSMLEYG